VATFSWFALGVSKKLSAEEATELATQVAELTKAGLPLGAGLRALAGELASRRLSQVLLGLADRLDAGDDLADAVDALGSRLPLHLRGLILAGLRSGQLPELLEEYVDIERNRADLRRRLCSSVFYPFMLLILMAALAVVMCVFIVPGFESIFRDFRTDLPDLTKMVIQSSRPTAEGMVALAGLLALVPILLVAMPHVRWFSPLLHRIPIIGPLLRWSHAAEFARLMSLLLAQRVPLPDALRLTSAGMNDADLAWGCRRVADDIENGQVLYQRMAAMRQFPRSMISLIEWGQRASALPDGFRASAEMCEGRARSQGSLLATILLPATLLFIVVFVGIVTTALFMPLISLIDKLSSH
jgi:type II secretory pathway component PulF